MKALLMLDQTNAIIGALIAAFTLLGIIVGWLRWLRPRWHRARAGFVAASDTLIGRPAVHDSITGREIAPALPGIGARMEAVEQAQVDTKNALEHIAALLEGQGVQDKQIADLDRRVTVLENAAVERVASKVESATAWQAIAAVAKSDDRTDPGGPPAPGDTEAELE